MWLVVAQLQSNHFPLVRVHDRCEICLTKTSLWANIFDTVLGEKLPDIIGREICRKKWNLCKELPPLRPTMKSLSLSASLCWKSSRENLEKNNSSRPQEILEFLWDFFTILLHCLGNKKAEKQYAWANISLPIAMENLVMVYFCQERIVKVLTHPREEVPSLYGHSANRRGFTICIINLCFRVILAWGEYL